MDFASKLSTRRLVAVLSGAALVATAVLTFATHAAEPVNSGLFGVNAGTKRMSMVYLTDGRFVNASISIINGICTVERGEVTHNMNGPIGPDSQPSNGTFTVKADTSKFEDQVQEFFATYAKSLGEVVQPGDEKSLRFTLEEAKVRAEKIKDMDLLAAIHSLRNELRETCLTNVSKSAGE